MHSSKRQTVASVQFEAKVEIDKTTRPDKVVFYLWPKARGAKFDFTFEPRFGMKAKSSPATFFDYYNPEAAIQLTPRNFQIVSSAATLPKP